MHGFHMDQKSPADKAAQAMRGARHLLPQERAKACRAIHELVVIESIQPATARRNARLRMLIGRPPFTPRTIARIWQ